MYRVKWKIAGYNPLFFVGFLSNGDLLLEFKFVVRANLSRQTGFSKERSVLLGVIKLKSLCG